MTTHYMSGTVTYGKPILMEHGKSQNQSENYIQQEHRKGLMHSCYEECELGLKDV